MADPTPAINRITRHKPRNQYLLLIISIVLQKKVFLGLLTAKILALLDTINIFQSAVSHIFEKQPPPVKII